MANEQVAEVMAKREQIEKQIGYRRATHEEIQRESYCGNCNLLAWGSGYGEGECSFDLPVMRLMTCDRFQKYYPKEDTAK